MLAKLSHQTQNLPRESLVKRLVNTAQSFQFKGLADEIFMSSSLHEENVSHVMSINSLSSSFNQQFQHEFAQLLKTFDEFIIGGNGETCSSELHFSFMN